MPSLREVQTKIQSVKKTKQITKAMNMVATSRLRGAQNAMDGFRLYADRFMEVLQGLADRAGNEILDPLMMPKEKVSNIGLILCTSDRGLCGGFNFGLIKKVEEFLAEKKSLNNKIKISFINFGKKGYDWVVKSGFDVRSKHLGIMGGKINFGIAADVGKKIVDFFLNDDLDEVYIVYSKFVSVAKQIPSMRMVLPIKPIAEVNIEENFNNGFQAEHICEPSIGDLFGEILPKSICVQLHISLLESSTSEHAARMTAMDNATKACKDMIDNLTLTYNKARQASITADLMDIIGGAEALKG